MAATRGVTAKQAFWLGHLRRWSRRSEPLSAYARRRGLAAKQAYAWRRLLSVGGLWRGPAHDPPAAAVRRARHDPLSVRFARVEVQSDAAPGRRLAPLTVRLTLGNGRCAEFGVEIAQLAPLLAVLERSA